VKRRLSVRLLAGLLLAGVAPCAAQYSEPERWRLRGSAGFGLCDSSTTAVAGSPNSGQTSSYDTLEGDLRLGLDGYIKDPKLLLFSLGLGGQLGSNNVDHSGYDSTLWGVTGNATFLPQRAFPLRVFYLDSAYDQAGSVFTSNTRNSLLGGEWMLRTRKLPKLDLSFTQQINKVLFATSLTDVGFKQNLGHVSLEDFWKQWSWRASFDTNNTDSRTAGLFSLPVEYRTQSMVPTFIATRTFWEQRGYFDFYANGNFQNNYVGKQSAGNSTLFYAGPNLRLQHTPKLSSSYSYTYTESRFTGLPVVGIPGAPAIIISTPKVETNAVLGRVDYQIRNPLRFFEQVRYFHTTPVAVTYETINSMVESLTGIEYSRAWRTLQVGASFAGDLQFVGTNFHHGANTFSPDFQGRVAWGDVQRIHLVGSFGDSKQNLVAQIGSFSNNRHAALEAESSRLHVFRIVVRAETFHIELLNPSGRNQQNSTNFQVQLTRRWLTGGFNTGVNNGLGALFPPAVSQIPFITTPLPVELLVPTPLLNRSGRLSGAFLNAQPRRNLAVGVNWRRENYVFANSTQHYGLFDVQATYRIGRFTVQGLVGTYLTKVQQTAPSSALTGLRLNRVYLRIARDFKVF